MLAQVLIDQRPERIAHAFGDGNRYRQNDAWPGSEHFKRRRLTLVRMCARNPGEYADGLFQLGLVRKPGQPFKNLA